VRGERVEFMDVVFGRGDDVRVVRAYKTTTAIT
jgi:hypothetical protein